MIPRKKVDKCYEIKEKEKKKKKHCNEIIQNVEHVIFTPLVMSANGGWWTLQQNCGLVQTKNHVLTNQFKELRTTKKLW